MSTKEPKTTIQVMDVTGTIERLWVEELVYKEHGVECIERNKPSHTIFIPYTSIRMISTPNNIK